MLKYLIRYLIGVSLLIGVLAWWLGSTKTPKPTPKLLKQLTVGSVEIQVEVVDTPESIALGLSGRQSLPSKHGMLFVFERAGHYPFWMKEMHFPIDIVWIGSDWRVVEISSKIDPSTFPQRFAPQQPSQYVLEVNTGFMETHQLEVGDLVKLDERKAVPFP